jgi:hypothetical protein
MYGREDDPLIAADQFPFPLEKPPADQRRGRRVQFVAGQGLRQSFYPQFPEPGQETCTILVLAGHFPQILRRSGVIHNYTCSFWKLQVNRPLIGTREHNDYRCEERASRILID